MKHTTNPNASARDLTIREHFTALAMEGLLTNGNVPLDMVASKAVRIADETIEQLNEDDDETF